jgi:hypothetical protein
MQELIYKQMLRHMSTHLTKDNQDVWAALKQARIFILPDTVGILEHNITEDYPQELSIPLPFKITWFERQSQLPLTGYRVVDKNLKILLFGLLMEQKEDSSILFHSAIEIEDETTGMMRIDFSTMLSNHQFGYAYVNSLMEDLRTKTSLIEEPFSSYFAAKKTDKLSRIIQPNKIIRVVLDRERKQYPKALETHRVDWSHRWEVRGHWRKVDGIGKDSSGEYCVKGFTWVKDQERGKKGVPVTKKTREFKTGNSEHAHSP